MKKILIVSSIVFGGILFAQNANFKQNYSVSELEKIQNSVPQNQKSEFYKQYLRAKIFEDMKNEFKHKKYSDVVLKKFTDSVITGNTSNEILENNDNKSYVPSETYEQFLKNHNEYISQNEKSVRKDFDIVGKILNEKEVSELVNIRMNQINNEKLKTSETLKKEYDTKINIERENFENDPSTIEGRKNLIKKIDQNFANKLQNSEETYQLLAQNTGLLPGQRFPDVSSEPNESSVYETIPGEILTYVTENGFGDGRHFFSYQIKKEDLIPINPIPYEDKNFEKKVSKYAKANWRFEDRTGYEIKKNKAGEYVISTSLFKDEDANCCPSMAIEYKTKDFKNFIPLRISKEENKWTTIK